MVFKGIKIDFIGEPVPIYQPQKFSPEVQDVISHEIQSLLQKGLIIETQESVKIFLSGIFTVPKRDGSSRLILNLKKLNLAVRYHHVKMETLYDVLNLVKPNMWMAGIDLKDAYYSIPVHPEW